MKKYLLMVIMLLSAFLRRAQNMGVEESTYGIQTGILGIWVHNEAKVAEQIALRSEFGFNSGIFGVKGRTGYLLTPVLSLEPRWYYNLEKRFSKSRETAGNSGNFFSFRASYYPGWFAISNFDNLIVEKQLTLLPFWGIKRSLGKHFTYETGIGVGYRYVADQWKGLPEVKSGAVVDLFIRAGYRF